MRRWFSLPVEDGYPRPKLWDGDSYLVKLSDGTELWANYMVGHGAHFAPCDDDGEVTGDPLDNVAEVFAPLDLTVRYLEED